MNNQHTNKLIHETSPYLLQHAHNPVDWYPWGPEALQKAKEESKVILVSIGYSACHWCHVMERESFENEETAKLMNDHFINIKIDREERPDIDHIYMDAVQAMTGSGGWPLNVFLTPEAKPFYGGTYFPPVKAFNRPSWPEVLQSVHDAWIDRRNEIEAQAENLTDYLKKPGAFTNAAVIDTRFDENVNVENCKMIFANIMNSADREWGGFGSAPKFPQTFTIQYLLQYHYYTSDQQALDQALLSIDKLLQGGIYDHVAGGLARYSTDNEWLAPHFEKMLYDNALLVSILCDTYQITKDKKYKYAIEKTLFFILEELTNKEGAFYAALDADSEGKEGKYYVWQRKEVKELLEEDTEIFCELFDISEKGNWEEKNIPRLLIPLPEFAKQKELNESVLEKKIELCLSKLKAKRAERIKPALDDKIILGWNALMLKSIAKASIVLQNEEYKQVAIDNFNFLVASFSTEPGSELMHTWKNGQAKYPAFLDDYAFLIDACLQMYELTLDSNYLLKAFDYSKYVVDHFSDEDNNFFYYTNKDQKDVIIRKKEIYDGATPSANAVMASNLLKLSTIFDEPAWLERANRILDIMSPAAIKYPVSFGLWACLVLQRVRGMNEIALFGENGTIAAFNILHEYYLPSKLMVVLDNINASFPFLKNKKAGESLLMYLCKNHVCLNPVNDITALVGLVNKMDKL
jgi:uncharacterized protein YyaL (SSP411 family)